MMDAVFAQIKARRAVVEVEIEDDVQSIPSLSRQSSFDGGNETVRKLRKLSSIRKMSMSRKMSKEQLEKSDTTDVEETKHTDDGDAYTEGEFDDQDHHRLDWRSRQSSSRAFRELPPPPKPSAFQSGGGARKGSPIPPPPGMDDKEDAFIPPPPLSPPQSSPNSSEEAVEEKEIPARSLTPLPSPAEAATKLQSLLDGHSVPGRFVSETLVPTHFEGSSSSSRQENEGTRGVVDAFSKKTSSRAVEPFPPLPDLKSGEISPPLPISGVDKAAFERISSELEKLRSAMEVNKRTDTDLLRLNHDLSTVNKQLLLSEKEVSNLRVQLKEKILLLDKEKDSKLSMARELETSTKENEDLKVQIVTLQRDFDKLLRTREEDEKRAEVTEMALEQQKEEIELLKLQLEEVRNDNVRIVQHIMNCVGGKDKLVGLLHPHGDQTLQDYQLGQSSTMEESKFVTPSTPGISMVPACTVSTINSHNGGWQPVDGMEYGSVGDSKMHRQYASTLERRVDRLRDAVEQAKKKEKICSERLRATRAANVYEQMGLM